MVEPSETQAIAEGSSAAGEGSSELAKKGDMWTAEEDAQIMDGVTRFGQKWQLISANVPGRSANAVRNRFLRCTTTLSSSMTAMLAPGLQPMQAPLPAGHALMVQASHQMVVAAQPPSHVVAMPPCATPHSDVPAAAGSFQLRPMAVHPGVSAACAPFLAGAPPCGPACAPPRAPPGIPPGAPHCAMSCSSGCNSARAPFGSFG